MVPDKHFCVRRGKKNSKSPEKGDVSKESEKSVGDEKAASPGS